MVRFSNSGFPQPPGITAITKSVFEEHFGEMDSKDHRKKILQSWNQLVKDLSNIVDPDEWTQWIGGSFTTTKTEPEDIDVVHFIDHVSSNELAISNTPYFSSEETSSDSRAKYQVDSYLVPVYPTTDPKYKLVTQHWVEYWKKWFGKAESGELRSIFELEFK